MAEQDGGAIWTRITWPDGRVAWQWAPAVWLAYSDTADAIEQLRAGGWEPFGTWPPPEDTTDTMVVRLWSQLADLRFIRQDGERSQAWGQTEDVAHARKFPVTLAFQVADAKGDIGRTASVIPPAQLGEIGFIEIQRGADTVVVRYEANRIGGELQDTQRRLSTALRILSESAPADFVERWGEARQMAQELAAAYWRRANHDKVADIPNAFDAQGMAEIPSAMPVQTILGSYSAATRDAQTGATTLVEANKSWGRDSDGVPTYRQVTPDHDTALQFRDDGLPELLDETRIRDLWRTVGELTDLDGDVFLAMLAQAIASPPDPDGVWITADQILEYRGVRPKTARDESGRERRAGHRYEDRKAVAECVARQSQQWIIIRSQIADDPTETRGKKYTKKLFTHEGRLTNVTERLRQHELLDDPEGAPSITIAWRFRFGAWATPFLSGPNRRMAWLCQQALQYDPYHEQWEKRLARYFMFYLRINAGKRSNAIRRIIGTLIDDLALPTNERYPEKTRRRFEQAMDRLVADEVIDGWDYDKSNPELPARRWLATWRSWSLSIRASAVVAERQTLITEGAKTRRVPHQGRRKSTEKRSLDG
jgi:hypothetical protein